MRALTICMLVALTISGTSLLAQEPSVIGVEYEAVKEKPKDDETNPEPEKNAESDKAKEPGLVKTSTWAWKEPEVSAVVEGVGTLGISVRQIDRRSRYWSGLPEGMGIEVRHVEHSGPGAQAGLEFGDYIVKIDDQWISNTYQFKALIRHLGPGHKARIHVRRSTKMTGKLTDDGEVRYDPPLMTAKDYIFEAILGETDGAPLVDPLEPMDWSKPPRKETVRHNGLTFNFRADRMVQAINAEGVIRYQGRDGVDWAKYLPKEEFPFAEMPNGVGGVSNLVGVPEVLSVGYVLKDEHEHEKTIVETAAANEDFSTLVTAVKAADLVETLSGKGPFTVFAPTNAAFEKLPEGTVASLLKSENKAKLTEILTYHVVAGKVMAKDVVELKSAETVQGSKVRIEVKDGTVMVGGAKVVKTDIACKNGVIHVIDAVMLPKTPKKGKK